MDLHILLFFTLIICIIITGARVVSNVSNGYFKQISIENGKFPNTRDKSLYRIKIDFINDDIIYSNAFQELGRENKKDFLSFLDKLDVSVNEDQKLFIESLQTLIRNNKIFTISYLDITAIALQYHSIIPSQLFSTKELTLKQNLKEDIQTITQNIIIKTTDDADTFKSFATLIYYNMIPFVVFAVYNNIIIGYINDKPKIRLYINIKKIFDTL